MPVLTILRKELYASEIRYRRLFESAKDGILILDAETGKIVDVNPFLIDLLGYSKKEFIEKFIWEIGAFQDIYENKEKFLELQQEEYVRYDDLPLVTSDGRKIYVEFVSNVYLVNNSKVIQCQIRDVTERKSKEDSLKETHRATSDSLSVLLNLMHTPIIIWDTSMIIKRFNRKFEHLSGYASAEVIDKKIGFLFPKDKIDTTLELLKNHLDDEQEAVEIDILTKDNHIKTVLWTSSRILDEKGNNIVATISQDITSRRQSELALRKSESHLRTLVNTIPDLIWLKDTNGVYLLCNPMFERFFGARETEIIGKTDYDFVDRELAGFFCENDRKAIEAGKPTSKEEWVTFADDGHRAFLDTIKSPIYDSDGTLLGILGIGRDITERMLAGQKLQASEKRFRAIFDQAPIAIALIDLQGHPILSNVRLSKMLGYSQDELSNMSFTDFTHPEDIEKDLNQFTDLTTGKISGYNMEKRFIHKNKNLIWANLFVTSLNDNNGVKQEIIAMVKDITEQKNFENKIKESEKQFRTITEHSADAIFITDKEGKYIYVNKQAVDLLGYSKEELLTFTLADVSPKNRIEEYFQIFQQLLVTGSSYSEIELVKKDGSYADTDLNAVLLPNGWVYGSSRDISKRKQLEKDLIIAKEKAEENDRLKSAFLANMSHEIRTPMNGILGFSGLLKDHGLSGDEQQEYIKIIEISGARLLNIINDIISISKIESQQVEIKISDTNINDQVEYIYRFFKVEAEQKKLNISFKNGLAKEDSAIKTDREKVSSVLTNLVKNALKFTQTGFIELGCLKKDGFLEFYVKDSGPGIPEEQKKIIFERFRQGSESLNRDYEGAGLGLAISKAYIEMLGGKIWVENNAVNNDDPSGSTFFFTIPVRQPAEVNALL